MNVSTVEIVVSAVVWLNLLILFLVWQRQTVRHIVIYSLLFLWFSMVTMAFTLPSGVIPLEPDGISYFQNATAIAASEFDPEIISDNINGKWTSSGPDLFTLLEAGIIYMTYPSFAFLLFGHIFVSTLAIFYIARFAGILFGPTSQKYVLFGIVIYVAWYWHVLQNLREALILLFMGVTLVHYTQWWQSGSRREGTLALLAALLAAMFRPENALVIVAALGLTLLYRHRAWALRIAKGLIVVPPLLYVAYQLGLALRNNQLFLSINFARAKRTEGGFHLTIPDVSSVWDVLAQIPDTFRFFLVPIWPWQIDVGLVFIRAYVHSVSALILLVMGLVGIVHIRRVLRDQQLATPVAILMASIAAVAALYSIIDIGAGVASRHSVFVFYFLLGSFAPVGFWYLRQKSAEVVRRPSTPTGKTSQDETPLANSAE